MEKVEPFVPVSQFFGTLKWLNQGASDVQNCR